MEELGLAAGRETNMMMIEQAKEELQILESQYPNRFEYLKLELKSFITSLLLQNQSHHHHHHQQQHFLLPTHAPAATSPVPNASTMTQESSTRKKRKKGMSKRQAAKEKLQRPDGSDGDQKRRDGVDAAIEKAQACLHKIQLFKTSF